MPYTVEIAPDVGEYVLAKIADYSLSAEEISSLKKALADLADNPGIGECQTIAIPLTADRFYELWLCRKLFLTILYDIEGNPFDDRTIYIKSIRIGPRF
jgi:hypothetical protein